MIRRNSSNTRQRSDLVSGEHSSGTRSRNMLDHTLRRRNDLDFTSNKQLGFLSALLVILLWSSMNPASKSLITIDTSNVFTLLWTRPLIGGVVLLLINALMRMPVRCHITTRNVMTALALASNFLAYQLALAVSPVSSAPLLVEAGSVVFVALYMMARKRLSTRKGIQSIIAFISTSIGFSGIDSLSAGGLGQTEWLLLIACPITWAIFTLLLEENDDTSKKKASLGFLLGRTGTMLLIAGVINTLIIVFLTQHGYIDYSFNIAVFLEWELYYVTAVCTGFAYLFWAYAVTSEFGAIRTSLSFAFIGVTSITAGALLISERTNSLLYIGGAINALSNLIEYAIQKWRGYKKSLL